ncbi:hypothetical protein AVEN_172984-1, partial [Araneus ventricosus]
MSQQVLVPLRCVHKEFLAYFRNTCDIMGTITFHVDEREAPDGTDLLEAGSYILQIT